MASWWSIPLQMKMKHLSFSLYLISPEFGFSNWLPSGLDGLLRFRLQLVILIIVLICSLFVVFKLFILFVSLLYYLINVTCYITYILFYKIVVSCITWCVTRPPTKLMMAKYLEAIDHTYMYDHIYITYIQIKLIVIAQL